VILKNDEVVPADMLLLASGAQDKICYVDNSGILGETSLEMKRPVRDTQRLICATTIEEATALLKRVSGQLHFTNPDPNFEKFSGNIKLKGFPRAASLDISNLLLRGSRLKATTWVLGLVVYTGKETKTQLNAKISNKKKISRIERTVNKWVIYILCVLLAMVIFSVVASFYLSEDDFDFEVTALGQFIVFILLYNNIIPISLFVTMDIIKLLQIHYLHIATNNKIKFKTAEVNEDMGQVEYILADKSGTITNDSHSLKACSIKNTLYTRCEADDLESPLSEISEDRPLFTTKIMHDYGSTETDKITFRDDYVKTQDNLTFSHLRTLLRSEDEDTMYFIKCMALCNTVLRVESTSEMYLACNMEEKALVIAAHELGYELISRTSTFCVLNELGKHVKYEIVASTACSVKSSRSRIVLRNAKETVLFVKGNPDAMSFLANENEDHDEVNQQLDIIVNLGLRANLLSYRIFKDEEAELFYAKIENARSNAVNPDLKIEQVLEEYEKHVTFLGVAGVEDTVSQDNKDAIKALIAAGIKIWILSGDKETNIVSAGLDSGIITADLPVISLSNISSKVTCTKVLYKYIQNNIYHETNLEMVRYNSILSSVSEAKRYDIRRLSMRSVGREEREQSRASELLSPLIKSVMSVPIEKYISHPLFKTIEKSTVRTINLERPYSSQALAFVLSLDGETLETALGDELCRKMLVCLLFTARTVCFNSILPLQKAQIVKLVKENFHSRPTVLAIGDSNSDIAMIQEANIGVGIRGKNGTQVCNCADVELESFSQLKDLLLVHGYRNYNRLSRSVLLFLYKNFVLTLLTFVYIFVSDFSGTSIFNASLLVGYNIFFTTLPIIVLGISDEDLSYNQILNHPYIYNLGVSNHLFNYLKLLEYTLHAIVMSFLLGILVCPIYTEVLNEDGKIENLEIIGTVLYVSMVLSVLTHIAVETYSYTFIYILSHVISVILLMIYLILTSFSYIPSEESSSINLYGIGFQIGECPIAFIVMLVSPLSCLIYSYAWKAYETIFKPRVVDMIRYGANIQGISWNRIKEYCSSLEKIYKHTDSWTSSHEIDGYDINKFTLHFASSFIEKQFQHQYVRERIPLLRGTVIVMWLLLMLWTIFEAVIFDVSFEYTLVRAILTAAFTVVLIISWTEFFFRYFVKFVLAIIILTSLVKFGMEIGFNNEGHLSSACLISITYILFNVDFLKITILNILELVLILISLSVVASSNPDYHSGGEVAFIVLTYMIFLISITITSGIAGYKLDQHRRLQHKLIQTITDQVEKSQSILGFLLPAFVKNRVKDGVRYIAEDQGVVTVMFCDIYDFDNICMLYSPQELTAFLDIVFQSFDNLCDELGVTKIETVGKTYMACAGLKDSEVEMNSNLQKCTHARRVLELAFRILHCASGIKLRNGADLMVKIGINTGPVIAGVVGHHKPQFSLVGDTVNTASRMCSTLELCNGIQISSETHDFLDDKRGIEFKPNQIEAKGKGILQTYLISESISINPYDSSAERPLESSDESTSPRTPNSTNPNTFSHRQLDFEYAAGDFKRNQLADRLRMNPESVFNRTATTEVVEKVQIFNFNWKESRKQKQFRLEYLETHYSTMKIGLIIAIITMICLVIVEIPVSLTMRDIVPWPVFVARCIMIVLMVCLLVYHKRYYKNLLFTWLVCAVYITGTIVPYLFIILDSQVPEDIVAIELIYYYLLINHANGLLFKQLLFAYVMNFIPWIIVIFFSESATVHATNSVFIIGFAIVHASAVYSREDLLRYYSNLEIYAKKEIKKTDSLVAQMMPPHVYENLKNDQAITDRLTDVTLLYADICGFTAWSSDKTPTEVVEMLSRLFTKFDKLCLEHDVYKVHTIGDCYVIMSYTGIQSRDINREVMNVVEFAERMIETINQVNSEHKSELNMRIGIHTGEVIAGITGTNIVRYDIYGPDVLIANKMESGGTPGRINVSDITKSLIERYDSHYKFEFNKEIVAKAVNRSHSSYFLA
jgi:magnesium-transporting ATPase (P-type)/class 3 adenylate cyclase